MGFWSINRRLVAALVAVALLAFVPLAAIVATTMRQADAEAVRADGERIAATASRMLAGEAARLDTLVRALAAQPAVGEALAARDRARLTALLAPMHDTLAETGITALAVNVPPATVFLRTNRLDMFGDDVSARRHDLVAAQQTGTPTSAFSRQSGGIGLAHARPLVRNGERIGVLSAQMGLGTEFFRRIAEAVGAEVLVHAVEADKVTVIGGTIAQGLTDAATLRAAFAAPPVPRVVRQDAKTLLVAALPLRDFQGQPLIVVELLKDRTETVAAARATELALLLTAAAILAVTLVAALLLGRGISRPIRATITSAEGLVRGEVATPVPGTQRRDELGLLAGALEVLRGNTLRMQALAAEQAQTKAEAAAASKAAMDRMADAFEARIGTLVGLLSSDASAFEGTARTLSSTAARTDEQAAAAAAAAEQASAGVGTVASAAEQLSASIREISRQVATSSEITGQVVEEAQRTDAIVRTLAEAAERIGDIVGLIANIASQTNLLALNATIEAARAGDSGKGFAVVASEVKNLASQTAKATDDISSQIAGIQAATRQAVDAIGAITGTVEQVSAIATTIAAAVEQQGAATAEIARNVQRTSVSTQDVTANIGGVSQMAKDTGSAAGQMLRAANALSQKTDELTAEVGSFVAGVRAA